MAGHDILHHYYETIAAERLCPLKNLLKCSVKGRSGRKKRTIFYPVWLATIYKQRVSVTWVVRMLPNLEI